MDKAAWPLRLLEIIGVLARTYADSKTFPTMLRHPRVLQFPVNDVCNARCSMCFIWRNERRREVTPDEFRTILARPLFRDLRVIGFNGGEPTIRPDLAELVRAAAETAPRLQGINLITNGLAHRTVTRRIAEMAEVCRMYGVRFSVMVSIDGIGAVHDKVRGRAGFFDAALQVLDFVRDHPGVQGVSVGATLGCDNAYDAENILAWCEERGFPVRFRLAIAHQRLGNCSDGAAYLPDADQIFHIANFLDLLTIGYEQQPERRAFYRSLRDQLVYGAARKSGCAWKTYGATLLSDGGLAYCAVQSDRLGSAIDDDPDALYWGNRDHLQHIIKTKCATCRHDYDGPPPYEQVLPIFAEKALKGPLAPLSPLVRSVRRWQSDLGERARIAALEHTPSGGPRARRTIARVLLTGWYGTETQGDKAILGGVVERLRAAFPDARFDLTTLEPYVSRQTMRQMPALDIDRLIPLGDARTTVADGQIDMVVLAGGPLMSPVGRVLDIAELFCSARAHGVPTLVAGCGVGPLGKPTRDKAIASILVGADSVVLRDQRSVQLARHRLGVSRAMTTMLDPAFLWIGGERRRPARDDALVLALRDWPIAEYPSPGLGPTAARDMKQAVEAELLRFVDHMAVVSPQTRIVPLCMNSLTVGGDDRRFYRRLFKDRPAIRDAISPYHVGPEAIVQTFETARAALVMRFHGAVFAAATETPFIALDYTFGGKVAGLAEAVGARSPILPGAFDGVVAAEMLLAGQGRTGTLDPLVAAARTTLDMAIAEAAAR